MAKALFRVLRRALIELQLVFAQRAECDFAELGLLAKSALRRDGAVDDLQMALGMKLQHLLVDEMQDTSTSQYELIELLTQGGMDIAKPCSSWGRSEAVNLFVPAGAGRAFYTNDARRETRRIAAGMSASDSEFPVAERTRRCVQCRVFAAVSEGCRYA